MATRNRRPSPGRRRPAPPGRRSARAKGRRTPRGSLSGDRGYGARSAPGPGQGPILALIGLAAVGLVVLLVILLSEGGGAEPAGTPRTSAPGAPPGAGGVRTPVPRPKRLVPLNKAEWRRLNEMMKRLAAKEPRAKELRDLGFRAQNDGRLDLAQKYWHEAQDLLHSMIEESELTFEEIGDERVERFANSFYRSQGVWQRILSDFFKYLK